MRGLWIVGVAALLVGCATKATKGLLDDAPFETLTEAGDLGFDRLVFPARDIALPSGLRVAYETTPSRGMVAVVLAIDVGSTSDPEGREGLAHYAEHLVFRNRPRAIELAFELARLGATYNASTTLDATTFHVIAPANSLPALIDLVADVLQRPLQTVDPGDANVELEVVRNELLFRNESGVYGQLRGWMQSLLIEPSHPYRRPVGGTAESVGRLTLQDAKSFAETHYKPAKATLLVAGDIKGERLDQLVKERFPPSLLGDPNHPVVRDVGPVPLLNVTLPGTPPSPPRHQAAVPLPEVWIGYLMPGKFSQNAGNTRLVTSGATEERLRELLNDDRDVLAVNLVPLHDRLATILAIQVVLASDGRREEIALRVRDVMGMMWQPLHPKMAELFAAATPSTPVRVSGGYVMVRPTAAYYAQMRAEQLLRQRFKGITDTLHGLEPWIDRALERAEYLQVMGKPGALMWANHQVALSQERLVGNFSQQFLAPERARFAYVDPLPAERQPRAGRTGVADRPIADERTATVVYEQPFLAPAPDELSKMHAVRLENGLQVVVVNRPTFPSVAAVLGFAGGAVVGQPPGVVELVQRLESLAGIGLPLNGIEATPIDGPSFTGDLVRAGARNLPNALFLLAQRIVDTDRTEWSALLDRKDDSTPFVSRISPDQQAEQLLRKELYGDHPLSRATAAVDLGKIRGADMEAWLPRMRNPRNALLAIVGKVSRHEGEQLARKWFGSWKGLPEALPFALPAVPPPRKTIGIEGRPIIVNRDGGDAQVLLALACRLPAAQHGSRATYQLLASALNGHLNTMVRYRAGAAYSVSSQVNFRSGGAADLWVTMDLETRRLSEALAAVRTLWTRLGNEGFDPGTVSQARWALATGYNLRYGTSAEVVLSVLENWSLGWPVNGLATYPTELRNSKPEDLTGPFRTCRESTVSLVLGEKAVVEGALAAQR